MKKSKIMMGVLIASVLAIASFGLLADSDDVSADPPSVVTGGITNAPIEDSYEDSEGIQIIFSPAGYYIDISSITIKETDDTGSVIDSGDVIYEDYTLTIPKSLYTNPVIYLSGAAIAIADNLSVQNGTFDGSGVWAAGNVWTRTINPNTGYFVGGTYDVGGITYTANTNNVITTELGSDVTSLSGNISLSLISLNVTVTNGTLMNSPGSWTAGNILYLNITPNTGYFIGDAYTVGGISFTPYENGLKATIPSGVGAVTGNILLAPISVTLDVENGEITGSGTWSAGNVWTAPISADPGFYLKSSYIVNSYNFTVAGGMISVTIGGGIGVVDEKITLDPTSISLTAVGGTIQTNGWSGTTWSATVSPNGGFFLADGEIIILGKKFTASGNTISITADLVGNAPTISGIVTLDPTVISLTVTNGTLGGGSWADGTWSATITANEGFQLAESYEVKCNGTDYVFTVSDGKISINAEAVGAGIEELEGAITLGDVPSSSGDGDGDDWVAMAAIAVVAIVIVLGALFFLRRF